MAETYREGEESNSLADRIINDLNQLVGTDVFEIEENTEALMDDDSDQEEEAYEIYNDEGGYN